MSARYVLLTLNKYKPETGVLTIATRTVTLEGSCVGIVTGSKVKYTISRGEVHVDGEHWTSSKDYNFTGRPSQNRVLRVFFIRLIRQKMRSVWTRIKRRVCGMLGREPSET